MLVSLIGTWIQTTAQSWLVFQLTNSAILLGVVGFLSTIPVFLLSLFGGVAADRLNKRSILIFTQTIFMLLAFILAVLTQIKIITPFQIMVIAVLNGIVMAFDAPSRQAIVAELVGRDYLLNAIALNSVAFNLSRSLGPALCGLLVSIIGLSGCFYVNGFSFLAVLVALLLVKNNTAVNKNATVSLRQDLNEVLRFIRGNRTVLILIVMVGITSLFGISYVILMPVFAHNVLKVGVKGLGALMSATGLGAVLAALLLARLGDFRYKGKLLISSSIIFSASLILFSFSRVFLFSFLTLILLGGSSVSAIALMNTLLQHLAPNQVRGRVMSVFMFTFAGIMPFGSLLAGSLAEVLGVSGTIFIGGVICSLAFLIINSAYPEIKEI